MSGFYTILRITSLSQSQMKHLMSVGLPLLFDTLHCFVHWIQVGWYDFHSLPLTMKSHLDPNDVISLRKICKQYNGKILLLISSESNGDSAAAIIGCVSAVHINYIATQSSKWNVMLNYVQLRNFGLIDTLPSVKMHM